MLSSWLFCVFLMIFLTHFYFIIDIDGFIIALIIRLRTILWLKSLRY